MTSPAARRSVVPAPTHTRCATSRSVSIPVAFRTAQRIGFRASPCGAARPLRAWLVGIALLWSVLWVQLSVVQGTLGEVGAISLFAVACILTVLYGMRSHGARNGRAMRHMTRVTGSRDAEVTSRGQRSGNRGASSPKGPPGIVRSSAAGVALLGLISWIPLAPLLAFLVVGAFLGSPLLLLVAAAITCVIAAGGFLLLLLLVGIGRLMARWVHSRAVKEFACRAPQSELE
jgi:hypothetical protein